MPLNEGDIVRVAARHKGPQGQDIVNVLHYKATGNIAASDNDIANAIANHLSDIWSNIEADIPSTQTPYDIKVDLVTIVNGVEQIVRNLGIMGWNALVYQPGGSGNVYAPAVAVGILLRTLLSRVVGKKYIGVLMEAALGDHGRLDSGAATRFLNFAAELIGDITISGATLAFGVLSRKLSQFVEVIEADVASEAYYQRRRSIRMGS
jgi:hypothetical protein